MKEQAANFDPVELYEARQAIRPTHEKAAEAQLKDVLQKKPAVGMLLNAKQEVSHLLAEDAEERQAHQMSILWQATMQDRRAYNPQKGSAFER